MDHETPGLFAGIEAGSGVNALPPPALPVTKTITLKSPCTRCGYSGQVLATYYPFPLRRQSQIEVRCPGQTSSSEMCDRTFYLKQDEYAADFCLTRDATRRHRRDKRFEPKETNVSLFLRHNTNCVYHAGNAEARGLRKDFLDSLMRNDPDASLPMEHNDEFERLLVADKAALERSIQPTLLARDLVIDHLIPVWVQLCLGRRLTASEQLLAGREWVVPACRQCNSERARKLESSQTLLFLYFLHLMPHRGSSFVEQCRDALAFVTVLDKIEAYLGETENVYRSPTALRRAK